MPNELYNPVTRHPFWIFEIESLGEQSCHWWLCREEEFILLVN
jgi:hypothetical protein